MFFKATAFNNDISNWDTSSVVTMSRSTYHSGVSRFFSPRLFHLVTNFVFCFSVFSLCSGAVGIVFHQAEVFNNDISKWNTEAVTSMAEGSCNTLFCRDSLYFFLTMLLFSLLQSIFISSFPLVYVLMS